jgi:hypothetical protein
MAKPAKNTICVWYNGGEESACGWCKEVAPSKRVLGCVL